LQFSDFIRGCASDGSLTNEIHSLEMILAVRAAARELGILDDD